jgi:hypothetical protein
MIPVIPSPMAAIESSQCELVFGGGASCSIGVNSGGTTGNSGTIQFNPDSPVAIEPAESTILVYGTPYITFTTNGLSTDGNESIAQGESFTVIATLTESGNIIESQTIESAVNGLIPDSESITFSPSSCTISSTTPNNESCSITVNVESTANPGSYHLTMKNIGSVTQVNGESIIFNVESQPVYYIFLTESSYNGNLGGLSGANTKCTNDIHNPYGPGHGTFFAALVGNNAIVESRVYVNAQYPAESNNFIGTANPAYINQPWKRPYVRGNGGTQALWNDAENQQYNCTAWIESTAGPRPPSYTGATVHSSTTFPPHTYSAIGGNTCNGVNRLACVQQ